MKYPYIKTESDIKCVRLVDDVLREGCTLTQKSSSLDLSKGSVFSKFKKGMRALDYFRATYECSSMDFKTAKANKDKIRSLCLLYLEGDL